MPDDFNEIPDTSRFDTSPSGVSVPSSGISDYPAHVAVINQDWLPLILGLIDRGGYSNVWKDTDDELYAFRQINELQANLMTTLYDGPFQGAYAVENFRIRSVGLTTGSLVLPLFTVPNDEYWKITSAMLFQWATGAGSARMEWIEGGLDYYAFYQVNPVSLTSYYLDAPLWLNPSSNFRMRLDNMTTSGGSAWFWASVEKFRQ